MTDPIPDGPPAEEQDTRACTDALRPRHGVVRNAQGQWLLLRHDLVVQAALDCERLSNAVSSHLQIPNGLDGDEHAAWREVLDTFLSAPALAPFHDRWRAIAADLLAALPKHTPIDAVSQIGARFAVRAQCAWLGWPAALEDRLVAWVAENHAAARSGDRARTGQVALAFDEMVRSALAGCRRTSGDDGDDSVTARLMRTELRGRRLTELEIVSVLRNWTGGDLGSMALCVGVLIHGLAMHPAWQDRLRAGLPDAEFDAVIDELLRIDDPFVSSRRLATCPVTIGGVQLPAGARVKLNWTSANRDEAVVPDPNAIDPQRNAPWNLVYGIGRHACPGRLLATVQMRLLLQARLAATPRVALDPRRPPARAAAPAGGWAEVPVVLS